MKDIPTKRLAAIVIVYRLLGINKDQAIKAMNELSTRTDFDYQTFIDEQLKRAPDPKQLKSNYLSKLKDLLNGEIFRGF